MTHALQRVLTPRSGRPEGLYVKYSASVGWDDDGGFQIGADGELTTDTYFNSLYLDVWQRYARIGRIGLGLTATGPVTVLVRAVRLDGTYCDLSQTTQTGSFEFWLDDIPEDAGRLFVVLSAKKNVVVTQFDWITDADPIQMPTLSVGLCTFNRETHIAATVAALAQQQTNLPELQKVYLVNQGKAFVDPALLDTLRQSLFKTIMQPNLGGCGGFTRSMLETLEAADRTTHHLLMDDDIVLDPRMLERVVMFLRFANDDIALGGQMLEVERPNRLYEAGGRLDPIWFVRPIGQGTDLNNPKNLTVFTPTPPVDYNAWFFCVLPVSTIENTGLPSPIFLRGDDIEYGTRIAAQGVTSIPLPGCGVWHEGFAFKKSDWLQYYETRNRLLLAQLHPDAVTPPDALYLLGFVMTILCQHRYRAVRMALKGLSDSLSEPDVMLGERSDITHQALMDWLATLPAPPVISARDLPETQTGTPRLLNPAIPAMIWMSVKTFIVVHLTRAGIFRKPLLFKATPDAPAIGGRDYYAATDPSLTQYTLRRGSPVALWSLTFQTLRLCVRYHLTFKKVAQTRDAQMRDRRRPAMWRKAFARIDKP